MTVTLSHTENEICCWRRWRCNETRRHSCSKLRVHQ